MGPLLPLESAWGPSRPVAIEDGDLFPTLAAFSQGKASLPHQHHLRKFRITLVIQLLILLALLWTQHGQ